VQRSAKLAGVFSLRGCLCLESVHATRKTSDLSPVPPDAVADLLVTHIRDTLHQELVLGNDRFKAEVERLTGQRQQPRRCGPRTEKSAVSCKRAQFLL
jgi:hypothetical protein